ncbi:cyclodeaminase/cyclohydrolase family protein [Devosia nitrariae]|uniref:Cyclodeaminase/cyclohydrolase domain-containing protein n=1 Tax=Devosia nitrariae TaxID=2071872 RepID=A0ABQ5W6R4_9HYPH|nr:cyclodeaminase/cyclohydrolase family protein [Devosia nitrariae]GLQ55760.1 hypothetical protein GCM10010862_30190 [Devosia nitrariae]
MADFADEVASSSPTPGGGSVSLVAGVLGAGLVAMAINVSLKGKAGAAHGAVLGESLGTIEALRRKLADLADADIAGFSQFMAAYRLPMQDDVQKSTRDRALAAAAAAACNVPLDAGEVVVQALHLAHDVKPLVSKMIVSDVEAGMQLLRSAGLAVLLNVDANLTWLPIEQRDTVVARATQLRDAIRASEAGS